MFRLLKILGVVPTRSLSSALTPNFKMLPLFSSCLKNSLGRSLILIHSKSSSCSNSKSTGGCSKSGDKKKQSCKRSPRKKKCCKVKTPSPSYSECRREPTVPKPFKECDCGDFDKC